jgi:two-component sensor histidine kinase
MEESVVLIVSELLTNAIRHGPTSEQGFEVVVTVLPDGICVIEVSDSEQSMPAQGTPGDADESGRGLRMVAALADTWGVRHRGRFGKTVWAVLGTRPGEGGT